MLTVLLKQKYRLEDWTTLTLREKIMLLMWRPNLFKSSQIRQFNA